MFQEYMGKEYRGASTVSYVGTNMVCFVSLSMITKMAEYPLDLGSCSMKSVDIEDHGQAGIGSWFSFLYSLCQGALAHA